jgi:beta-lactamase regulating signal transducer with metallopeptidase domain
MNTFDFVGDHQLWTGWGVRLVFAVSLVWLTAALVVVVLRRGSAALRHRVWALSIVAVLALPVLIPGLPEFRMGWFDIAIGNKAAAAAALPGRSTRASAAEAGLPSYTGADRPPVRHVESGNSAPNVPRGVPVVEADSMSEPMPEIVTALSSAKRWGWLETGILFWAVPTVAGLLWMVRSVRAARRLVRQSTAIDDSFCEELLRRLIQRCGYRGAVALRQSDATWSPLCVGSWRPCIVLPTGWRNWTAEQLGAAMSHELAHVVRCDVGWQLAARTACCIYWFHPFAWLAARCMRAERETACDDHALEAGHTPTLYARVLLGIAEQFTVSRPSPPSSVVAMATGCRFERRIRSILAPNRDRSPVSRCAGHFLAAATLVMLILAGVVNPLTATRGESGKQAGNDKASAARQSADRKPAGQQKASPDKATSSQVKSSESGPVGEPTIQVAGRIVDEQDRPVAGAKVEIFAHRTRPSTLSTADGRFALRAPKEKILGITMRATAANFVQQAFYQLEDVEKLPADLRLVMRPGRKVEVHVKDDRDRPVAGASVAAMVFWYTTMAEGKTDAAGSAILSVPADASLQYVYAFKPDVGLDYFVYRRKNEPAGNPYVLGPDHRAPHALVLNGTRTVTVRVLDHRGGLLPGVPVDPWYFEKPKKGGYLNIGGVDEFSVLANGDGQSVFHTIPADNTSPITFWACSEDYFAPERAMYDPKTEEAETNITLLPLVTARGHVVFADGAPAVGATVSVAGAGYAFDGFQGKTRAGADGSFEIQVNPDQFYLFAASLDRQVSRAQTRVVRLGQPVEGIRLILQAGARVHGRVTAETERRPLAGQYLILHLQPDREHDQLPRGDQLPNPRDDRKLVRPRIVQTVYSSAEGTFEFFAGPGKYDIMGPRGADVPKFEIVDDTDVELNLHSDQPQPAEFRGRVVLKSDPDTGVAEAGVFGVATDGLSPWLDAVADADGNFQVMRYKTAMLAYARTDDGKLAGIVRIGPDDKSCVVPVAPTTSARGTLVDENTGKALSRRQIDYSIRIDVDGNLSTTRFSGSATTDADGEFVLPVLVTGWKYDLRVVTERDARGKPRRWTSAGSVTPEGDETVELGVVKVPPLK